MWNLKKAKIKLIQRESRKVIARGSRAGEIRSW